jgi:hypothetical protein
MKSVFGLLGLVVAVLAVGCGGTPDSGAGGGTSTTTDTDKSTDSAPSGAAGSCKTAGESRNYCYEYGAGYTAASGKADCDAGNGLNSLTTVYSATACAKENVLGRCTTMMSIAGTALTITTYYFAPSDIEQAKAVCLPPKGTWSAN